MRRRRRDEINIALLASLRDQLFAEALRRYRVGEKGWPDQEFERQHIMPEQDQRYEEDAWEEPIESFLRGRMKVTLFELATLALQIDKISAADQRRIDLALQHLGWSRGKKSNGRHPWIAPARQ